MKNLINRCRKWFINTPPLHMGYIIVVGIWASGLQVSFLLYDYLPHWLGLLLYFMMGVIGGVALMGLIIIKFDSQQNKNDQAHQSKKYINEDRPVEPCPPAGQGQTKHSQTSASPKIF